MFEETDQVTVIMGRRTKNLVLASVVTLASLLIGVEVAAYLTVPLIHVTSEGDAMVVFELDGAWRRRDLQPHGRPVDLLAHSLRSRCATFS